MSDEDELLVELVGLIGAARISARSLAPCRPVAMVLTKLDEAELRARYRREELARAMPASGD